jgi:hypothetical protein
MSIHSGRGGTASRVDWFWLDPSVQARSPPHSRAGCLPAWISTSTLTEPAVLNGLSTIRRQGGRRDVPEGITRGWWRKDADEDRAAYLITAAVEASAQGAAAGEVEAGLFPGRGGSPTTT